MKLHLAKIVYVLIGGLALLGFINSSLALLLGFLFSFFFKNPFKKYSYQSIHWFLKISVVGLGFGMFIKETLQASKESFSLTFYSIVLTVGVGVLLTRVLKLDKELGHLITSGTAICGGSAIAAISPIIKANNKVISVALGIVFLLNAVALLVFPLVGGFLGLSQHDFGLWCAIAIHDTSSVVGAALGYGEEALRIATVVKLSRTLWIVPLSIFSMFLFKTKNEKIKVPYFILLFLLAIVMNSFHWIPVTITNIIVLLSKRLLVLTLFVVGATILVRDIKDIGVRPILMAMCLWLFISFFSLLIILK